MNKSEFERFIIDTLEDAGYSHISVSVSLFGEKAKISALDPYGDPCRIKAKLVQTIFSTKVNFIIEDDSLDWIDELEFLDAIFDDN